MDNFMEKIAPTQFPIHELLARRWSPRAFSPHKVEPGVLMQLFEAARWAASSFNEQPWSFIVATSDNAEQFQRMLSVVVPFNAAWVQHAPVVALSVAKLRFAHNNEVNRHALHDVGQAAASLAIQATALGLAIHQMAGFDVEKARAEFSIPAGYEPGAVMAIGYPGDADSLPAPLREKELAPRSRQPLDKILFAGKWGETSPLLGASGKQQKA